MMKEFTHMGNITPLGRLTVYMCEFANLTKESLQDFVNAVENEEIIALTNLGPSGYFTRNRLSELVFRPRPWIGGPQLEMF